MKKQLFLFGLIGLGVNAALYGAFLALLAVGFSPHAAQAVSFGLGTLLSYGLNRRVTFADSQPALRTLPRFVATYGICYVLNIIALAGLLSLGLAAWAAQAICVVVSAICLFTVQKLLIFNGSRSSSALP
jgi:putative flippase GtrA